MLDRLLVQLLHWGGKMGSAVMARRQTSERKDVCQLLRALASWSFHRLSLVESEFGC